MTEPLNSTRNELVVSVDVHTWQVLELEHGTVYTAFENKNFSVSERFATVMKRDRYICHYCGFQSAKHQEVHHLDGDHSNHDPANLVTVCPLCHQAHHLSMAHLYSGAVMVWNEDFSQTELNDYCRTVFILKKINERLGKNHPYYMASQAYTTLYTNLLEIGRNKLEEYFEGSNLSDCGNFGQMLLDIRADDNKNQTKNYANRNKIMKNIKMLPSYARFQMQCEYWADKFLEVPSFALDKLKELTHFRHVPLVKEEQPKLEDIKKAFKIDALENLDWN